MDGGEWTGGGWGGGRDAAGGRYGGEGKEGGGEVGDARAPLPFCSYSNLSPLTFDRLTDPTLPTFARAPDDHGGGPPPRRLARPGASTTAAGHRDGAARSGPCHPPLPAPPLLLSGGTLLPLPEDTPAGTPSPDHPRPPPHPPPPPPVGRVQRWRGGGGCRAHLPAGFNVRTAVGAAASRSALLRLCRRRVHGKRSPPPPPAAPCGPAHCGSRWGAAGRRGGAR